MALNEILDLVNDDTEKPLNKLKEETSQSILQKINGVEAKIGGIKSIQSGFTDFSGATQDGSIGYKKEITISTVNPNKCVVLVQSSVGRYSSNNEKVSNIIYKRLLNNKLILFSGESYYDSDNRQRQISWQVIEYY